MQHFKLVNSWFRFLMSWAGYKWKNTHVNKKELDLLKLAWLHILQPHFQRMCICIVVHCASDTDKKVNPPTNVNRSDRSSFSSLRTLYKELGIIIMAVSVRCDNFMNLLGITHSKLQITFWVSHIFGFNCNSALTLEFVVQGCSLSTYRLRTDCTHWVSRNNNWS